MANALNAGAHNALTATCSIRPRRPAREQIFTCFPASFASLQNTPADQTLFAREAMLDRMRQGSYAGASGDMAALSFGGPALSYGEVRMLH